MTRQVVRYAVGSLRLPSGTGCKVGLRPDVCRLAPLSAIISLLGALGPVADAQTESLDAVTLLRLVQTPATISRDGKIQFTLEAEDAQDEESPYLQPQISPAATQSETIPAAA